MNIERLENFWRKEAGKYAKRTLPNNHPYRLEFAKLLLQLNPKTILEVGSNASQNLLAIYTLNPHIDLYGCDIAPVATEAGCDKAPIITEASAYDLPYPDNFADLTFAHGLLMHLPPESVGQAVSELVRVSSRHIVIREDVEIEGDGSYRGEPNAIFIHDYRSLFKSVTVKEYSVRQLEGRQRATGVFEK